MDISRLVECLASVHEGLGSLQHKSGMVQIPVIPAPGRRVQEDREVRVVPGIQ